LCAGCTEGKCAKRVGEIDTIECPACGGRGCEECNGGQCVIECPMKYVDRETRMLIQVARHAKGGMWPVPGGLLEQSARFASLADFVNVDEQRIQAMIEARAWRRQI
jgi:hypothetical protein